MTEQSDIQQLRLLLRETQQDHLLNWWDELTEEQQQSLKSSLESLDLQELQGLLEAGQTLSGTEESDNHRVLRATAPSKLVRLNRDDGQTRQESSTYHRGLEMLASGRVGVILVAGGQGSRLGFPHPKGLFPIGPVSGSSLFRILCEQLRVRSDRAGCAIPLFIMTSHSTHQPTIRYFEQHSFFGLQTDQIHFFMQGNMPAVDRQTGRILMSNHHQLCMSPDGHGGLIKALDSSGLLEKMASSGIDALFYHQVDNPAVRVCDPEFLGLHADHEAEVSIKVVAKTSPDEKMGAVVEIDGKTQIIEYSDLPAEHRERMDASGQPVFWAGNTAIHVFKRQFLESLVRNPSTLPFHRALKQMSSVEIPGVATTSPEGEPNAVKFERFIFDAFPAATRTLVVEADRQREFHPVKNASGPDSPESVRTALLDLHHSWITEAGGELGQAAQVEISPLVALESEDLRPQIAAGMKLDGSIFLNEPVNRET